MPLTTDEHQLLMLVMAWWLLSSLLHHAFSEKDFIKYICYFSNPIKDTFSFWRNKKSKPVWEQGIKLSLISSMFILPSYDYPTGYYCTQHEHHGCFYIWLLVFWRDLQQCMQPSLGRDGYEIAPNRILVIFFPPHLLPFSKRLHPLNFQSAWVLPASPCIHPTHVTK